jgi:hypothetical protein
MEYWSAVISILRHRNALAVRPGRAEALGKRSVLFKLKEGENLDRRNTQCILRIQIQA